jgi:AraC-like DNA-binding protein
MNNVKFNLEDLRVYKNQPGEKETHRKAGFRISHFQRSIVYEALDEITPRTFDYYSLCHLIEGKGWYWSPGKEKQYFSVGEGVISTPGFVQSYGGDHSTFIEDFICFDGPVADFLYQSGVIRNGIVKIGPIRRLLPVIKDALNLSDSGQINANISLQVLLHDLYRENFLDAKSNSLDGIDKLLEKLSSSVNQWWSVAEMAEFCHLSENHFRRLFKNRTGMSPKHYSDCLKMQIASERLLSTDFTLNLIADQLGYVDRFHFSKVFKRIKGLSPDLFRRQYLMV